MEKVIKTIDKSKLLELKEKGLITEEEYNGQLMVNITFYKLIYERNAIFNNLQNLGDYNG